MRHGLKSTVSREHIQRIIHHQFGRDTAIARITTIRGGLFNTAYKLQFTAGRTVVLRIAPPKDKPLLVCETALLEREIWFLQRVHEFALPVPKLLCADLTKAIIDRNYLISEFSDGQNAFYRLPRLTPPDQNTIYSQLGEYARRIHTIENPEGWFGAPPPLAPHRTWREFMNWHALSLCEDLRGHPYLSLPPHISVPSILESLSGVLDEITTPKLVHADLWLRNILIAKRDGTWRITAILDWDRSLWGDPYFEWILHGLDLPPVFWEKYGPDGAHSPSHVKRRFLYKACGCLQAALEDSVHFRLKKQSLQMLGHALTNFHELLNLLR